MDKDQSHHSDTDEEDFEIINYSDLFLPPAAPQGGRGGANPPSISNLRTNSRSKDTVGLDNTTVQ